jgi:hypothetical protein
MFMFRSDSDLQPQGSLSISFYEQQGYGGVKITILHRAI